MAYSIQRGTGDGSTDLFPVNFVLGFLSRTHVKFYVEGEVDGTGGQIYRDLQWLHDGLVRVLGGAPPVDVGWVMFRDTPKEELIHDYVDGVPITEGNLDSSNLQHMMIAGELLDGRYEEGFQQDLNLNGFKIINMARGTQPLDAINKEQFDELTEDIQRAQEYADQAIAARNAAIVARNESEDFRDLAYEWANNPEDVVVDSGEFSAYHWAKKAEDSAGLLDGTRIESPDGLVSLEAENTGLNARGSSLRNMRDTLTLRYAGAVADTVEDEDIAILRLPSATRVFGFDLGLGGGTLTATFKCNGVAIDGLDEVAVDNTYDFAEVDGGYIDLAAGDVLSLAIADADEATDFFPIMHHIKDYLP